MSRNSKRTGGFSLLELLITLVIFSVGLLTVAGLQTVSKQANYEAIQRTTASQIANGMLENMRINGDAINIYVGAADIGQGSRGGEPAPNCKDANVCNSAQKAAHDLWYWEQMLDGNLETNGGVGTGGLHLPAMCITGPPGGIAGIYVVTIAWRGTASINNSVNNPCGAASGDYGAANEFRRIIQIPTFIDPTM